MSPYKGFCCAYRARTKRPSCSEFAKRVALRRGLLALPALLRERFKRCAGAARAMAHRRGEERERERRSSSPTANSCADGVGDACVYGGCDPFPCDAGAVDACELGCGGIDL